MAYQDIMLDPLQEALKSLPHGAEFRFLDRLRSLVPGQRGTGEYRVRGDEHCLRGHLPGEPILPGVILVEAAAQLAGVVAQNDPAIEPLPGLKLTALRGVKFLGSARPGETMVIEATIIARLGALVQARASVSIAGSEVMSGELTLGGTGASPLVEQMKRETSSQHAAQRLRSAGCQTCEARERTDPLPTGKSATQQVWKPALRTRAVSGRRARLPPRDTSAPA